jgi:RNA recognition motif-containing protein
MEPPSARLYVGNIDYRMPIQELEMLFAQFGLLEDVFLPQPPPTNAAHLNRGFAFVCFRSPLSATAAVESLHGSRDPKFHRRLVVQYAKPRPEKP